MRVEVVRSARRRKTVELRPTSDGVRISIPAHATKAEEERYVKTLIGQYERRRQTKDIDLMERATRLAHRYRLQLPSSIQWADNQSRRWGSCTPETRSIRISSAVAKFPPWVVDYVIVHELAHLSVHGHGAEFWSIVTRYSKTERARGFLIAKGLDTDDSSSSSDDTDRDEPSTDGQI